MGDPVGVSLRVAREGLRLRVTPALRDSIVKYGANESLTFETPAARALIFDPSRVPSFDAPGRSRPITLSLPTLSVNSGCAPCERPRVLGVFAGKRAEFLVAAGDPHAPGAPESLAVWGADIMSGEVTLYGYGGPGGVEVALALLEGPIALV